MFEEDYHGRVLAVAVLARERFGRKVMLGEAQINLASLDLTVRLTAWYRLFSTHLGIEDTSAAR